MPYDKNRYVAFEWKRKYDLIYTLRDNPALIEQLTKSYLIDYIFSQHPISFPARYPLVYSNNTYYIYDVRN